MGHTAIITYLLDNGAKTEMATVRGETALHLAARANQTEVMRILIRAGAQVDAKAKVRILEFVLCWSFLWSKPMSYLLHIMGCWTYYLLSSIMLN